MTRKYSEIKQVVSICRLTGKPYQFKGSNFELIDGFEVSGSEQHRGKRVLKETRLRDNRIYYHWWYGEFRP